MCGPGRARNLVKIESVLVVSRFMIRLQRGHLPPLVEAVLPRNGQTFGCKPTLRCEMLLAAVQEGCDARHTFSFRVPFMPSQRAWNWNTIPGSDRFSNCCLTTSVRPAGSSMSRAHQEFARLLGTIAFISDDQFFPVEPALIIHHPVDKGIQISPIGCE